MFNLEVHNAHEDKGVHFQFSQRKLNELLEVSYKEWFCTPNGETKVYTTTWSSIGASYKELLFVTTFKVWSALSILGLSTIKGFCCYLFVLQVSGIYTYELELLKVFESMSVAILMSYVAGSWILNQLCLSVDLDSWNLFHDVLFSWTLLLGSWIYLSVVLCNGWSWGMILKQYVVNFY